MKHEPENEKYGRVLASLGKPLKAQLIDTAAKRRPIPSISALVKEAVEYAIRRGWK